MGKEIFRKVALERLASPEQLDRLMKIVGLKGWIALFTLIGLIVLIGIWSVISEIPITVNGRGILFDPKSLTSVRTKVSGIVEDVSVIIGENVKKGDVLAVLKNPIKEIQVQEKQALVASMQEEIESLEKELHQEREIHLELQQFVLEHQKNKLKKVQYSITNEEQKQPKNEEVIYQLQKDLIDLQIAIKTQETEILLSQNLMTPAFANEQFEDKKWKLLQEKSSLQVLSEELKNLHIVAPENATVIEIEAIAGEQAHSGTILMWLQTLSYHPLVYGFVPIVAGDKITRGMPVKIELASVNAQKYGMLKGVVKDVLFYGASESGERLKSLPSLELRKFLISSESVLVVIEPLQDTSTVSGFLWTSNEGPPFKINPGTVGNVKITIESRKPIEYVFPKL